ncbi:MAG TPA: 50S ribosomal protein L22 [Candidatus Methylomirabilis sp.]|nr:50S ribosomal protein L22 [Candidatus Methylomirabilis sp.]
MEIKVKLKFIRQSSKKLRLVANLIRGLDVTSALNQLRFVNKKGAEPIAKLLKSAIASAENDFELAKDNLFVKEIRVDEGGMLKRWTPKAHGSATPIRQRISHINITLGELKESGIKAAKKKEVEAPISLEEMAKEGEKATKKGETKEIKKTGGQDLKKEGATKKGFVNKMFQRKSGNG